MDENQQTRFINAFARFVSLTYARRFDEFSGDPNITVGRALDAGRKGILVETPFASASQQPIAVEWLISDRGGRVEIIDLVVDLHGTRTGSGVCAAFGHGERLATPTAPSPLATGPRALRPWP